MTNPRKRFTKYQWSIYIPQEKWQYIKSQFPQVVARAHWHYLFGHYTEQVNRYYKSMRKTRGNQGPWPCYTYTPVSRLDPLCPSEVVSLHELAGLEPLPQGFPQGACVPSGHFLTAHIHRQLQLLERAQQGRLLSLKEGRIATLPLWIDVVVLTVSLESLILWSASYYTKADVQLGSFPNSSLKSVGYSASVSPWKFLSLCQSAWLVALKRRQLSRSQVVGNPHIMTASFSDCRADMLFPDSCTHFTPA